MSDRTLLDAFEAIFGPQDWDRPREWDGAIEGPDEDLFVSEAESRYRQQCVDAELTEKWGPQC